ncbi:hypothetical protein [Nostoc sp. FACHB-280]|nr:hypothetical protein [Nostoc sp. FACHB-280]
MKWYERYLLCAISYAMALRYRPYLCALKSAIARFGSKLSTISYS